MALPHTWSTYETTGEVHPFIKTATERDDSYWWYGWGWYRKHFTISSEHRARLVFLEFDGVQKYARILSQWDPGGEHKGGYNSFSLDVTAQVHFGGDNLLARAGFQPRRRSPLRRHSPDRRRGNFDVYGGIYRDVRLVITDRLHVPFQGSAEHEGGTFVTTPAVNGDERHRPGPGPGSRTATRRPAIAPWSAR